MNGLNVRSETCMRCESEVKGFFSRVHSAFSRYSHFVSIKENLCVIDAQPVLFHCTCSCTQCGEHRCDMVVCRLLFELINQLTVLQTVVCNLIFRQEKRRIQNQPLFFHSFYKVNLIISTNQIALFKWYDSVLCKHLLRNIGKEKPAISLLKQTAAAAKLHIYFQWSWYVWRGQLDATSRISAAPLSSRYCRGCDWYELWNKLETNMAARTSISIKATALQRPTAERRKLKTASYKPTSRLLTEAGLELRSLIHLASQIRNFIRFWFSPDPGYRTYSTPTPRIYGHAGYSQTSSVISATIPLLFLDLSLLQSHGLHDLTTAPRFLHYLFLQMGFTHVLGFYIVELLK